MMTTRRDFLKVAGIVPVAGVTATPFLQASSIPKPDIEVIACEFKPDDYTSMTMGVCFRVDFDYMHPSKYFQAFYKKDDPDSYLSVTSELLHIDPNILMFPLGVQGFNMPNRRIESCFSWSQEHLLPLSANMSHDFTIVAIVFTQAARQESQWRQLNDGVRYDRAEWKSIYRGSEITAPHYFKPKTKQDIVEDCINARNGKYPQGSFFNLLKAAEGWR
jgi:hypothetical protein